MIVSPISFPSTSFRRLLLPVFAVALLVAMISSLRAQTETGGTTLLLDAARSRDDIVAVGERGTILRSADSGRSWERLDSGVNITLTAISFAPHAAHGWIVGHDATILATSDGGVTWAPCYRGKDPSVSFLSVLAFDTNHVLAVGAFGVALETRDGGVTWAPVKIAQGDNHLNALCRIGEAGVLAVGEAGLALYSSDGGATWTPLSSPYEGSFFCAHALGEAGAIIAGLRGHVFRIVDMASPRWIETPTPAGSGMIASVTRLKNGTWVAAGRARGFLVSHDDGRNFKAWDPGITTAVSRILQAPDGTLLAFGEAGATPLPEP